MNMTRDEIATAWIGREFLAEDVITPRLVDEFHATLAPHLYAVDAVPPGLFLCLAPDVKTRDQLGADGHVAPGLIGPDLGLPRRMWAGGEFVIHDVLDAELPVQKTSRIEAINFKDGSTGPLAFLTMRRHYTQAGRVIIDERQDIVYRDAPRPNARVLPQTETDTALPPLSPHCRHVETDSTLLFRYSALTFNGHRIHYDYPYATEVEAYQGLVVHGPMQATLVLNHAAMILKTGKVKMAYRGVSPLICGKPFAIVAEDDNAGGVAVKTLSSSGATAMTAQVTRL